ncbi:hypothetical protein [Hymenobacter chitinivorans]|uniref:Lipoprotein n=1 Tax=Hymenobacter chitinivorans DSM 11115 TaxID=1121954 RepID=A0A2M9AQ98_9BACT|nr:hypothetical protein [Hymenobacter chitinivorans]PJJ47874.1 hypothetical protein CLV45_4564 [Hymenobacter chitinivorans DSM 11115]
MVKNLLTYALGGLLLASAACSSKDVEPQPEARVTRTDEFVSAKADGQYTDCQDVYRRNGTVPDTLFNGYRNFWVSSTQRLQQIDIMRLENAQAGSSKFFILTFGGVDLDALTVPAEFTSADKTNWVSLSFGDYSVGKGPVSGPDPNLYSGSTLAKDNLVVKVLSKDNDVLTGTFRGPVRNTANQTKTITEGQFRIKLLRKTRP